MVSKNRLRNTTVIWLCIVQPEIDAAVAILDEEYEIHSPKDQESYRLGRIGDHQVAITYPPSGTYGTNAAADIASRIPDRFPNARFGLLVGIAGGCPNPRDQDKDIRLGDVVVSRPRKEHGGVLQIDMGQRTEKDGFKIQSHLDKPPRLLRNAIAHLQNEHGRGTPRRMDKFIDEIGKHRIPQKFIFPGSANDRLFQSNYRHEPKHPNCNRCDPSRIEKRDDRKSKYPRVHYGTIASGNMVMKDAQERDRLRDDKDVLCFEMEAAGVMDSFPFLVIRGICDYSDSHKNKNWQHYAAFAAAAYAKDLLACVPPAPVLFNEQSRRFPSAGLDQ
ncbi:nucleoside phosphorylase domain-containing protein [Aspergillus lucknowensis]|uniref:Nucleoside phosphorylase domain-containing protein n=1 Tax=Aspergillus lucknowensis TaxID=176173 RepID=A0ABR4LD10_9EURO